MPFLIGETPSQKSGSDLSFSVQNNVFITAQRILDIIFKYRSALPKGAVDRSDEGAMKALSIIYSAVKANKAVRMVLPAFPFKSPNPKAKVLGTEPDKAEDVALAHLNGLCAAIQEIYSPGAILVIVSDGLVYNVPDLTVWNYGQKLRALAKSRNYDNIEFARLNNLLVSENFEEPQDDMSYAATASVMRLNLMKTYSSAEWADSNCQESIKNNENKRLTYCGYLKFLELDLALTYPINEQRTKSKFKRGVEKIAKTMLQRGDAFARAVRNRFPNHVRLSIHPSTGEDKISINVLPVATSLTPWHNCVGFKVDGTIMAGHRRMFEEMETMELIEENGKPSYFREKSHLYNWGTCPVQIEHLYPCGTLIRPAQGIKALSIDQIDALKVRTLAEQNSPVVLRGFTKTKDREKMITKSYEFGKPTPWKFGLVLEVKDQGSEGQGLNNVLSAEWMPFHFDGMFKTEKCQQEDGTEHLIPRPPRFQFFSAVTPSPKNTGYTLFAASKLVFQYLPRHAPLDYLKILKWSVRTTSFNNAMIDGMDLVTQHPVTGQPCLRYHERWPQEKTRFDPTLVEIDNGSQNICDVLESLLHDRRVCYWHSWEEGDLLINDNLATMHTRSSFASKTDRELWRIHFD